MLSAALPHNLHAVSAAGEVPVFRAVYSSVRACCSYISTMLVMVWVGASLQSFVHTKQYCSLHLSIWTSGAHLSSLIFCWRKQFALYRNVDLAFAIGMASPSYTQHLASGYERSSDRSSSSANLQTSFTSNWCPLAGDEGLTLKTSVFESFAVATLWLTLVIYFSVLLYHRRSTKLNPRSKYGIVLMSPFLSSSLSIFRVIYFI